MSTLYLFVQLRIHDISIAIFIYSNIVNLKMYDTNDKVNIHQGRSQDFNGGGGSFCKNMDSYR